MILFTALWKHLNARSTLNYNCCVALRHPSCSRAGPFSIQSAALFSQHITSQRKKKKKILSKYLYTSLYSFRSAPLLFIDVGEFVFIFSLHSLPICPPLSFLLLATAAIYLCIASFHLDFSLIKEIVFLSLLTITFKEEVRGGVLARTER